MAKITIECADEIAPHLIRVLEVNPPELISQTRKLAAGLGLGQTDPSFESANEDDLSITLNLIPQEVGEVIVLSDDQEFLAVVDYSSILEGRLYGFAKAGQFLFAQKNPEGSIDRVFGMVSNMKSLANAIKEQLKIEETSLLEEKEEAKVIQLNPAKDE